MGDIHFKRDFREKPYSDGDKIPPGIKAINMIKTFYSAIDKQTAAKPDKILLNTVSALESMAQSKHGLFEFNYDDEYNYLMIKITLPHLTVKSISNIIDLRTLSAMAHMLSIEPVDCENISVNIIFSNIKI